MAERIYQTALGIQTGDSLVCWSDQGVSHEPGRNLVGVEVWEKDELNDQEQTH